MNMPQRASPGGLMSIIRTFVVAVRLFFSNRVPGWAKVVPLVALAYVLFPLDFLPDFVPGVGQLDDLTIFLIGVWAFLQLCPQDVVREYMGDSGPVDAEFRVVKDDNKQASSTNEQLPPPTK